MCSQQRREKEGGETGGHWEEVALHGNMSIPKAVCVQHILSCPCVRLLAAGMNVRDAKVDNVCMSLRHSLQHSLWISLLSEGGPNILTVQDLLPGGVGECKCVCVAVMS